MKKDANRITLRAVVLGAFFAGLFAALTMILDHRRNMYVAANQVPLFPYMLLILSALLVNPFCRLLRVVRKFSRAEMLVIFIMGMVSSGIASFGLAGEWIPLMSSLFNRHWNNDQSEWNYYVEPFLNEHFFISEPGIRDAAQTYRKEALELRELERVYDRAVALQNRTAAGAAADDGEELPAAPDEILRTYPDRISQQEQDVARTKADLRELEEKAFEKVEVFRRGLPRGKRAFPGFVPVVEQDNASTYFGRLKRLYYGKKSSGALQEALNLARKAETAGRLTPKQRTRAAERLQQAAAHLEPIAQTQPLEEEKARLNQEASDLATRIGELSERLVALNQQKRNVDIAKAMDLESEADDLAAQRRRLEARREDISFTLERNQVQLKATERVAAALADIRSLRDSVKQGSLAGEALVRNITATLGDFPSFDASLRRFFLGDVPWRHWMGPLLRWGVLLGLTYIVLMTFNVLIFRQWAYNEKLIYPLAELPEVIIGDDIDNRWIPRIFCNGLFWVGFLIAAGILGWNLLVKAGALPGMDVIDMENRWFPYVRNTSMEALGGQRAAIFFTMIGVAFLIPKKVSFSLWFFWLLYIVQLQFMVWGGRGQSEASFPSEFWYTLNFRTAEGGGALLVFASTVLYKSRQYILCALTPSTVKDLPADERLELRIASFLFLGGSLGIVLMLWKGLGINLGYAVFGYFFMVVVTIALVRAVSEGGILSYKAYFGPFHFIRHTAGFDKAWTAPQLVAPLMVYYSVLLLDIKAFIGPAMANSLKIRDDLGFKRGRFHVTVALCILVGVAMSFLAAVMMGYASGADSMSGWFYGRFPQVVFDRIASMAKSPPVATVAERFWLGFGAVLMSALLFFRQRFFWVPHPIGLIMLVNPIMQTFWFSIFLGWIAKSLVTKYGNKETYARVRGLFVGLIVAELVIVFAAMIVSLVLGKNLGIDLNRN